METPTPEQLLISRIIQDRDLSEVADAGITAEYFLDANNKRVFQTIVDYKREHGEVPRTRRIRQDYPNYKFIDVTEPFSDLTQQIRFEHDLGLVEEGLLASVEAFDSRDPLKLDKTLVSIKATLHTLLTTLESSTPNMKDTDLSKTGDERWEKYEAIRLRTEDLLGITSGFDRLDRALQGFQPGQLIVFVGPPKAGKSTMMLIAALAAHRAQKVPLLIGFEMSNDEQEQRIDAMTAKISHHRLRGGKLTTEETTKLSRALHTWDSMKSFVLSNDTMGTTNLSGVESKVEKYKPDILIVDGVYMMQDENGETDERKILTNLTRGFKRLCQNKNIPTIITTQVLEWKMDKKRGVTTSSIGYSSSFGQDADALVSVESTDDPMVNRIKIIDARNAPRMEFHVRWDWETGEFRELEDGEFEAMSMDSDDQQEPGF